MAAICETYTKYVKSHYLGKSTTVVFDGYTNSANNTKAAEQERRYRLKQCADINIQLEIAINVKQEHFLSNSNNKSRLISILRSQLEHHGINTRKATDDADLMVVATAIEKSRDSAAVVIGEDIDLAVLLIARTLSDQDIILVKPNRGKVPTTLYSTQELQAKGLNSILFLHAFTGCDTTSAAFRKSKIGLCKLYLKSREIQEAAKVFYHPSSTPEQIQEQGFKCFLRWYGAKQNETSLNNFRYQSFLKSVSNVKPDISSLQEQLLNTATAPTTRFRFGWDMIPLLSCGVGSGT